MNPAPLLPTSDLKWGYQLDPFLKQKLRMEIKEHYEKFLSENFEFLPGTGKSINVSEFHQTAINADEDTVKNY